MYIRQAAEPDLEIIKKITHETIKTIFPRYYPYGVVDFFVSYHSTESIAEDIGRDRVFVMEAEDVPVGTVTIKDHEICRLFVLPGHQRKGYGKALMEYAEEQVFKKTRKIRLDASLPAKEMYMKLGYKAVESHTYLTENGDYLCYDVMEKMQHIPEHS